MKRIISTLILIALALFALPLTACGSGAQTATEYCITATYDDVSKTLTGRVEVDYYNSTQNEISQLNFNLWGNAYRQGALYSPVSEAYRAKAYYAGDSYGQMTISNVENCDGWQIGGEDENLLIVTLLTPIYPQDNAKIAIDYSLSLANVNHRTGVSERCVNLGNFYPILCAYGQEGYVVTPYISCGDPFVSECANYTVTLTYPAQMVCATSGQLQKESNAGNNKTATYALTNARDFAIVLSADFKVATTQVGQTQVSYYYYADDNPQQTLTATADSLSYFQTTFGDYVYPTLSVVQTGFCMGGMEYPALTMISDSLGDDIYYTVVHENAHQWWYAMVGSDQINCAWQDEGLAEYSTLMFFENTPDYGLTRTGMIGSATKAYRAFYSVYNQIFGDANTAMNRSLKEFISDYEYANIAYNKGLLLFDCLRTAMGDQKFVGALREYYSTNLYSIASQEGLMAPFVKRADVEGVFTSYIEGKIII